MKLAYQIDEMLRVEVVGDLPDGAVVAVEPAQAREAWASILGDKRWLEIRAGRLPSGGGITTHRQRSDEREDPS
jgi:hypothetical protein